MDKETAEGRDSTPYGDTGIVAKLQRIEQRKNAERELIRSINEKVDGIRQYINEA